MQQEREEEPDRPIRRPPDIDARLGEGEPLEASVRTRWEWAFGRDLSAVRVHDDPAADSLAAAQSASAFAVGDDIGFRAGEFRPGTLRGDALVAHELAHVVQQQGATSFAGAGRDVEADANRSALAGIGGISAAPRMRTGIGLRLNDCGVQRRPTPPSYLGPASREALRDIERITGNMDLVQVLIVGGTAVTMGTSPPEENLAQGVDLTPQAAALLAIPVITYGRVIERIQFLQLEHGNDLNAEERAFWDRMMAQAQRLMTRAVNRSRSAPTPTP